MLGKFKALFLFLASFVIRLLPFQVEFRPSLKEVDLPHTGDGVYGGFSEGGWWGESLWAVGRRRSFGRGGACEERSGECGVGEVENQKQFSYRLLIEFHALSLNWLRKC